MCSENLKYRVFKRAGENVFLEGMKGDSIYIIKKGTFVS